MPQTGPSTYKQRNWGARRRLARCARRLQRPGEFDFASRRLKMWRSTVFSELPRIQTFFLRDKDLMCQRATGLVSWCIAHHGSKDLLCKGRSLLDGIPSIVRFARSLRVSIEHKLSSQSVLSTAVAREAKRYTESCLGMTIGII